MKLTSLTGGLIAFLAMGLVLLLAPTSMAAGNAAIADSSADPPVRQRDRSGDRDRRMRAPRRSYAPDSGYYDEPPLDFYQRNWRWFTRNVHPQHFARRDLRRNYGYNPPFYGGWSGYYPGPYGYGYGYGYGGLPFDPYAGQAYIQGRYDERRFQQWREYYEKGRALYSDSMQTGLEWFRDGDYDKAVRVFLQAARQNQGDPASRMYAAYALVAIGNYDKAASMIHRALDLQPRIAYLPMDIRDEYGAQVDFDAHLRRLTAAVKKAGDNADLWLLLGYYRFFSGDSAGSIKALRKAMNLAPEDPIIRRFYDAVREVTPSAGQESPRPRGADQSGD